MRLIKPLALNYNLNTLYRHSTATYFSRFGTIDTAGFNEPRWNFDPENMQKGASLLLEPQATNLFLYSEQFGNAVWGGAGRNVVPGQIYAPDYNQTADLIVESGTTATVHNIGQSIQFIAGTTYTTSYFFKAGTRTQVILGFDSTLFGTGVYEYGLFDLVAGTVTNFLGTNHKQKIQKFTNGWYRCSVTATVKVSAYMVSAGFQLYNNGNIYIGNGVGSIYVWGAQLEIGNKATSYILTTSTTAYRAAEDSTYSQLMTNVSESYPNEWSSAISYIVGETVMMLSTHKKYECLVNNTNFSPDVNLTGLTPKWLDTGSTNKWAMFDGSTGSKTTNGMIIFTINNLFNNYWNYSADLPNTLALLNVVATSITVNITQNSDSGMSVYSKVIDMTNNDLITDWGAYFFSGISFKSDLVLMDLPRFLDAIITVSIINETDGSAECGLCVFGTNYEVGGTQYGSSAGIADYSVKTTDNFGNTTIVKRSYAKRMTTSLMIKNQYVDDVFNTLANFRSTPLVWIGTDSNYTSLIVYGFYKDFDINIAYPDYSSCSLTIEGLT